MLPLHITLFVCLGTHFTLCRSVLHTAENADSMGLLAGKRFYYRRIFTVFIMDNSAKGEKADEYKNMGHCARIRLAAVPAIVLHRRPLGSWMPCGVCAEGAAERGNSPYFEHLETADTLCWSDGRNP